MAQLFGGQSRNINDLPEGQSFDLIPDGWYNAVIEKAELKDTKDYTGKYIDISYKITGPAQENRLVFGNVNIQSKSEKAEEIGLGQLRQIAAALGLASISDTEQLVNRPVSIKVGIKKGNEGYSDKNDVKAWKSLTGSPLPAANIQPATTGSISTAPAVKKPTFLGG